MKLVPVLALFPFMSTAANYSAKTATADGVPIIRLEDAARKTEVSIIPSVGNIAYEMKVNGADIFWSPYRSIAELKAKPVFLGNPFLAPWANRLDGEAYWANGKKYILNPDLGNVRYDGNHLPIHGLVSYAPWQAIAVKADEGGAEATSRLEFWKHPEWMAQFPFAHAYEMTYRLANGELEVRLTVENLSAEQMPVSVAFHPYYKLPDAPRDDWKIHLAATEQVALTDKLVPTGEKKPLALPDPLPLAGRQLDDVYSGLRAGDSFWVQGNRQKLSFRFGPKYTVAVVYAPPGKDFICFEPMSGPTNAFNLNHAGKYPELQHIRPGERWTESFWISPAGF